MRRRIAIPLVATVALGLVVAAARPAAAVPAGWADLTFAGASNDYRGTMTQRPSGFPQADFVSDSTSGTSVGLQGGTSTFLSASTPVGAQYGSSRGRPYLNLRPYTSSGSGQPGSSTTTYTFDRPTPATGWTFVLGDVDADEIVISATGADQQPVAPADLGFRSTFNYAGGRDLPTWIEAQSRLRGNPTATDTDGASAWFEPSVPLRSLTFVFTRRAGFPVYQTWFSALSHTVRGTTTTPPGLVAEDLVLRLFDPSGTEVATTRPDSEGRYSFGAVATYAGYRLQLDRPVGYTSDQPLSRVVDLDEADQRVDFTLRPVVPSAVSGRVSTADGPVPGATVTLRDSDDNPIDTAVTDPGGDYQFESVPDGASYALELSVPAGYTAVSDTTRQISVPTDSEDPITGQDFRLAAAPTGSATGTVRERADAATSPAAGVLVRVTGPGGAEYVIRTDDDGRWSLEDLPPGDYLAAVTVPAGSTVVGSDTVEFTIDTEGSEETGLDFLIDRPAPPPTYSASGSVTEEGGDPVPDVTVRVVDPNGNPYATARTDVDGRWELDGLGDGDWTAQVVVPRGYQPEDALPFTVDGADVVRLDVVLTPVVAASPIPTPVTTPLPSPSSGATETESAAEPETTEPPTSSGSGLADLADTGSPADVAVAAVLALTLLGTGIGLLRARGRHRRT